jgi:hypothetical protein
MGCQQVCISFVKILYNVTRPHSARLGNIPGSNIYRNVEQYPDAALAPGIVAVRIDAAIYFSNDKVLHYLEDEVTRVAATGGKAVQYLIVDLTRTCSPPRLQFLCQTDSVNSCIDRCVWLLVMCSCDEHRHKWNHCV